MRGKSDTILPPYDFSKGKFNKIMFGERLSQVEKNIKKSIQSFEDKAIEVINSIQNFNLIYRSF